MATQAKRSKGKVAAEIGAGLLAAGAAAAAGYYFYASKNAKKHRKIAAKWAGDMKNEVVREAKNLKNMDAKSFGKVVDAVANTYQKARSIDPQDLKRAASELKANLSQVRDEIGGTARKTVSRAKTAGKRAVAKATKAVKKTVKKAAPKKASKGR